MVHGFLFGIGFLLSARFFAQRALTWIAGYETRSTALR